MDWQKIKKLGKGGQGNTWLVENVNTKSKAVIKFLNQSRNRQARARMVYEVENLNILYAAGGYVPKVMDDNLQEFKNLNIELNFVMEYVNGSTLTKHLNGKQNGRCNLKEAIEITKSLIHTIKHAHKLNILHRDLKPDNLMLPDNQTNRIIVVDFGLSYNKETQDTLTRVKESVGNKFLELPESKGPTGDRRDKRTDITYVVGLFYYLITGEFPNLLLDENFNPPHKRRTSAMNSLLDTSNEYLRTVPIFNRGFNQDISFRYQTIDELEATILKLEESLGKKVIMLSEFKMSDSTRLLNSVSRMYSKLSGLINDTVMDGIRVEFAEWMDRLVKKYLIFCTSYSSFLNDQELDEDFDIIYDWPESITKASEDLYDAAKSWRFDTLSEIECEIFEQIFPVDVSRNIECQIKSKICWSKNGESFTAYRRHPAAQNWYHLSNVIHNVLPPFTSPLTNPNLFIFNRNFTTKTTNSQVMCGNCGDF